MNLKNPLVSILTEREGDYRFFEAFRTREPVREVLTLSRRCFPGRVWGGAFFKKTAVCSRHCWHFTFLITNQRQRRRRSRQNSVSSSCESQTLAASVYGGQWSSIEPAAASGRRHSRPVAAGCRLSLPSRRAARARFARGRGCHRPRRSAPGRTDSRRCPHCAPPRRRCRGRRPCRRRPD